MPKKPTIATADLSPQESAAREKANIPLDAPLTAPEIQAREAEKAKLLARITPALVEKAPDTASIIGKFIAKAVAPSNTLLDIERAECEKVARPLLSEARGIQTSMGLLRNKWQEKVESYVGTDWRALARATPQYLVFSEKARMNVDVAGQAVHNCEVAVTNARVALASTFGDDQPGPKELNTVGLKHAALMLENLLVGDNYINDKALDGHSVRVQTAVFRQAVAQTNYWLQRSRAILQGAEFAVERFANSERVLNEILAKLEPAEVEARLKRSTLPKLEERPERGTSSYVDFDPRSN